MANTPFTTKIPAFTPPDFTLTTDFTSATWNTTGNHQIATVTGLARVIMLITCVTALTAASTRLINLMWESGANSGNILPSAGFYTHDQISLSNHILGLQKIISGSYIYDQGYVGKGVGNSFFDVVLNNADLIYSLSGALTGGSLKFLYWVYPLESNVTFAVGNGS